MITENRLALPTGSQVGPYRIQGILGQGGFGITYLTEHTGLQRLIALKELLPVDFATRVDNQTVVPVTAANEADFSWARERFIDEARILATFHHPNILAVHDIIEANNTAYMATGYEEGADLEVWLRSREDRPSEEELLTLLHPLLDGLETIHESGLLHRDIKPGNLYISNTDGRPILLDFGSARQAINSRSRPITSIITPGYAPFEQYHDDGNQGPWSDLYALGAVVHRILVDEKPPDATKRIRSDSYQPLQKRLGGHYSPDLLAAVDWALAPFEEDRPQSVCQWRNMLSQLTKPTTQKPPPAAATPTPDAPQVTTPSEETPPESTRTKSPFLGSPAKAGKTLHVTNINCEFSLDDIWELFSGVGSPAGAFRPDDEGGECYVEMRTLGEAKRAAEIFDGENFMGFDLEVEVLLPEGKNAPFPDKVSYLFGYGFGTPRDWLIQKTKALFKTLAIAILVIIGLSILFTILISVLG